SLRILLLTGIILSALPIQSVFAQAGIGIKPANIDEMMDPGESREFIIDISNLSGQEQIYYVYSRDIISATDAGVPVFAEEGIEETGFEMKQWISFSSESFSLP